MKLSTRFLTIFFATALAVGFGQGPKAGQNQGQGNNGGRGAGDGTGLTQLDLTSVREITGTVTAVNITAGAQQPSIVVEGELIRLGPVWYLLENDFEVSQGDLVVAQVASSYSADDPYLHAIWVRNLSTDKEIQLRSETGKPNWTRDRGGYGGESSENRQQTGTCGFSSTGTATGTILESTVEVGVRQPNLVIDTESGAITVKVGPTRLLTGAGLQLEPGNLVTVEYGVTVCTEEMVAIVLTQGDVTVILRNSDGSAAW